MARTAPVVEPDLVELDAFVGRPPVVVDVARAAPFGWKPALVLALVAFVDRADAGLVSGVLERLKAEFGFGDAVAGLLLAAPVFAAALLLIPAGVLADTGRRTRILAVVIAAWSLLTLGTGLAPTLAIFFLVRILLGAANPLNQPPAASLIGDYYPPRSRTKAFGLVRVIEYIGLPVGLALGGVLAAAFDSWRAVFFVMALPGLLVIALVLGVLREPVRGVGDRLAGRRPTREREVTDPSPALPATGADAPPAAETAPLDQSLPGRHAAPSPPATITWRDRFRMVLAIRTLRILVLAQALLFFGFGGLFSFAAAYFDRTGGLDEASAAALAGSVGLVGIMVGGAIGGVLGDRYHGVRPGWRLALSGVALIISAGCVALLVITPSTPIQLALLAAASAADIAAIANLGAATTDVLPAALRGSGFAVVQAIVQIGSGFGPILVGVVSGLAGENLGWGFAALLPFLLLGGMVVLRARESYEVDRRAVLDEALA
jgi:MFS family permease